MKLGLGTVQFGLDYGLSNRLGKTLPAEAGDILRVAREAGIRTLDTAWHYGDSEAVLGRLTREGDGFEIVTKAPALGRAGFEPRDGKELERNFFLSLERLKRDRVYGFLLHNADDLAAPGGRILFEAARNLAGQGFVRKIGVSVYTQAQIEATLANYAIDLIQLPISVLDQRLLKSGTLARIKDQGVDIHARSAFLQGLIFLDPESLDPYFAPIKERLAAFHRAVERAGAGPVQAALAFLRNIPEIDRIIIGVNTAAQLRDNIQDYCRADALDLDFGAFAIQDERMVNPALWGLS